MRIRSLKLTEVRKVGDWFAYRCTSLVNLNLPKLEEAYFFAHNCPSLVNPHLPKLSTSKGP